MRFPVLLPAMVIFLTGCAGEVTRSTDVPFPMIENQPHATLHDGILDLYDPEARIIITTPLDDCETIKTKNDLRQGVLFRHDQSITKPRVPIRVPAGKPFYIQYLEMAGAEHCFAHVVVTFEAGKHYTLVGGHATARSLVSILLDEPECNLGVLDNETKTPIPHTEKLCS